MKDELDYTDFKDDPKIFEPAQNMRRVQAELTNLFNSHNIETFYCLTVTKDGGGKKTATIITDGMTQADLAHLIDNTIKVYEALKKQEPTKC